MKNIYLVIGLFIVILYSIMLSLHIIVGYLLSKLVSIF